MTASIESEGAAAVLAPSSRPRSVGSRILTEPGLWLALYLVTLAFVAFWPVPIDRDARGTLDAITAAAPWLTYARIEFIANVGLFAPFGFLLVATLRRRAVLSLTIAFAVSVVCEAGQAMFLIERTPSPLDILANTAGAAVGIALALISLPPQPRRG